MVNTMKMPLFARALALFVFGFLLLGISDLPGLSESDKPATNPKVDSALIQVLQQLQGGVSAQAAQRQASQMGVSVEGNMLTVVVEVSGPTSTLISAIAQLFGSNIVRAKSRSFLKLQIPLSSNTLTLVLQLADLAGIAYIRPPLAPQALVLSQGVALTGASGLQANGIRGQGAKIAVIDLGFASLSTAQSRGEVPTNVVTFDFTGTGLQNTTSHGTAVAEIIYDMAPNAQIYLMKISDEVDLENAVDEAIRQGVDVINHSIGWFNTNFYNGTGAIDAAAARARAAGIVWVNAAGNYAKRHWQGFASDGNGNGWVEFTGREGLQFTAQAGELIHVFLTWNDWPRSAQDYDLFVVNSAGFPVAASERLQSGTQPPTETLIFSAPMTGSYEIRVKAATVTSPKQLAIFNLNQDINPAVAQGSVVAPAECSCALAVGAVNYLNWTTGPIEPFSSQGPTPDGRIKPDLVGPSSVSVSTVGWNPFVGTSAAAPHVAAAAALLLSENPALSAGQLEARLKGDAVPMGAVTQFGAGRLQLTPQVVQRPDLVILSPDFSPRTPRIGDIITITAQIRNQGNAAAGPFAVQLRDSFGTLVQNFSGLSAGASVPISFQRQISSPSDTVTLTVDPFGQVSESNESNNVAQLTVSAQSQPTLSIDVRTDRSSYRIGESIQVTFTTNADGYVYIYDVDAQGLVTLLYPRAETASAFLSAGTYDLANLMGVSRLMVSGPTGVESVHGVLTSSPISLQLNGLRSSSLANPTLFRDLIAQRIQASGPGLSWAWDVAQFQISDQPIRNQPPIARFTFSTSQPVVNQVVTFDGSGSSDPDGTIVDWRWVFEGTNRVEVRGVRVNVRFTTARAYRVTLTVTDNQGATASTTQTVEVRSGGSTNQPPVAGFTFSPQTPQINEVVTFDGRSSTDPDGRIVSYRWDLNGDGRTDATGSMVRARYSRAGTFQVTLTVTDNGGLSSSATQTIQVGQTSPPPPPPPPTPGEAGFFLISTEPNKLQIVVQGDPSWTGQDHSFQLFVRPLTGFVRGGPEAEVIGNAATSVTRVSGNSIFLSGRVRDGKVVYTMEFSFSSRGYQLLEFAPEMDLNGDNRREKWPQVPAFIVIGEQTFKVEIPTNRAGFILRARSGSLLPFSTENLEACEPTMRTCVRFP